MKNGENIFANRERSLIIFQGKERRGGIVVSSNCMDDEG